MIGIKHSLYKNNNQLSDTKFAFAFQKVYFNFDVDMNKLLAKLLAKRTFKTLPKLR